MVLFDELQLISHRGVGGENDTGGQFNHRVCTKAKGNPAADHVGLKLQHSAFLSDKDHVDRKLHSERVNSLTRLDPQPFACGQPGVFQQAGPALFARVSDHGFIGQYGASGQVANQQICISPYPIRRGLKALTPLAGKQLRLRSAKLLKIGRV